MRLPLKYGRWFRIAGGGAGGRHVCGANELSAGDRARPKLRGCLGRAQQRGAGAGREARASPARAHARSGQQPRCRRACAISRSSRPRGLRLAPTTSRAGAAPSVDVAPQAGCRPDLSALPAGAPVSCSIATATPSARLGYAASTATSRSAAQCSRTDTGWPDLPGLPPQRSSRINTKSRPTT